MSLRGDLVDFRGFSGACRNDELAAFAVWHAVRVAERIEHPPALDAVAGPEGTGWIVHAGVDDLGVARRYAGADRILGFGDNHVVAVFRGGACDRQADYPRPNDQYPHVLLHTERGPSQAFSYS